MIKRLLLLLLDEKSRLSFAVLVLLLAISAEVSMPIMIKYYIDDYLAQGVWFNEIVGWLFLSYVMLLVAGSLFLYLHNRLIHKLSLSVITRLRKKAFKRFMNASLLEYQARQDWLTRLTNDIDGVSGFYTEFFASFIKELVLIVGIISAMFFLSWKMALLVLLATPVVILLTMTYRNKSQSVHQTLRDNNALINAQLSEHIELKSQIYRFDQSSFFSERIKRKLSKSFGLNVKNLILEALTLRPAVELIQILVFAGLLLLMGLGFENGGFELGVMMAFFAFIPRFFEPIINIVQRLGGLQQSIEAARRAFVVIDCDQERGDGERFISDHHCSINFQNVSFAIDKKEILKNINLSVPVNEYCLVVGKSGSGKSTMLNLLLGLHENYDGTITINQFDLSRLHLQSVRRGIGLVSQQPELMIEGLDSIEISNTSFNFAKWLGVALGENWKTLSKDELSIGQQQFVVAVLALIKEPKLLVLDEATAFIDANLRKVLYQMLLEYRSCFSLTVFEVAHHIEHGKLADQILVLEQGEVVENDNHLNLMALNGYYAGLQKAQILIAA